MRPNSLSSLPVLSRTPCPNAKSPPLHSHWAVSAGPHQLLKSGLVQVTLECELAERFPRRLVGLHLHCAALHSVLMADGAARHQGRPSQSLEALRGKRTAQGIRVRSWLLHHFSSMEPQVLETDLETALVWGGTLDCTPPQWRYPRAHKSANRFTTMSQTPGRGNEIFYTLS